jgi:hypothetical protein
MLQRKENINGQMEPKHVGKGNGHYLLSGKDNEDIEFLLKKAK